jgi:hypothetical protein
MSVRSRSPAPRIDQFICPSVQLNPVQLLNVGGLGREPLERAVARVIRDTDQHRTGGGHPETGDAVPLG